MNNKIITYIMTHIRSNKLIPVWIIASIILINCALHINASPGCLDNSKHLTERFDNKSYQPVSCNCPCWKYKTSDNRGECSRCGHAHDLKYDLHAYKSYKNYEKNKIPHTYVRGPYKKAPSRSEVTSLPGLYKQFKNRI